MYKAHVVLTCAVEKLESVKKSVEELNVTLDGIISVNGNAIEFDISRNNTDIEFIDITGVSEVHIKVINE